MDKYHLEDKYITCYYPCAMIVDEIHSISSWAKCHCRYQATNAPRRIRFFSWPSAGHFHRPVCAALVCPQRAQVSNVIPPSPNTMPARCLLCNGAENLRESIGSLLTMNVRVCAQLRPYQPSSCAMLASHVRRGPRNDR